MEIPYINEVFIKNHDINRISKVYNIARCTIKIYLNESKASGIFLKFKRNEKPFYCFLTNQHVIESESVEKKKKINIKYDNDIHNLELILDREERIIICFKEVLDIDVTLVEIIPKDKINDFYFLTPNMDNSFLDKIGQNIQLVQFPLGNYLSYSNGKITQRNCDNRYYFFHNASTKKGSSGSPIVLLNDIKVFAIHKGSISNYKYNIGIFIRGIIEIMEKYKKTGKFRDYDNNGRLKYEGYFKDDEYNDDNGTFYFENGDIYIGQFKNGKKHGKGFIIKNNSRIIEENVEFENDKYINKEEDKNSNDSSENENKESENKKENENENNFCKFIQKVNWEGVVKEASHVLQPLGNMLGYRCDRPSCQHESKSHKSIGFGRFKCMECPEDLNICEIKFN